MSDLKLFQAQGGTLRELESSSAPLERELQTREVTLKSHGDLERAKPLIVQSYEAA